MKITELWVYPIKSLQGVGVSELPFDALGPCADRRYMLVDSDGNFFTQRQSAALSQVKVALAGRDITAGFEVQVGQHPAIFLAYQGDTQSEALVDVSIWSDKLQAFWQQHPLDFVLSEWVGQSIRLVYVSGKTPKNQRRVDREYTQTEQLVGFADGFPSLICTQASFEAVKEAIVDLGGEELRDFSIQRFRPNIVIEHETHDPKGHDVAFVEHTWQALENKTVRFDLVKPCSRCVIPTINPRTAEKQAIVWRALKLLNCVDKAVYFGQNAMHNFSTSSQLISVGDSLKVIEA